MPSNKIWVFWIVIIYYRLDRSIYNSFRKLFWKNLMVATPNQFFPPNFCWWALQQEWCSTMTSTHLHCAHYLLNLPTKSLIFTVFPPTHPFHLGCSKPAQSLHLSYESFCLAMYVISSGGHDLSIVYQLNLKSNSGYRPCTGIDSVFLLWWPRQLTSNPQISFVEDWVLACIRTVDLAGYGIQSTWKSIQDFTWQRCFEFQKETESWLEASWTFEIGVAFRSTGGVR